MHPTAIQLSVVVEASSMKFCGNVCMHAAYRLACLRGGDVREEGAFPRSPAAGRRWAPVFGLGQNTYQHIDLALDRCKSSRHLTREAGSEVGAHSWRRRRRW